MAIIPTLMKVIIGAVLIGAFLAAIILTNRTLLLPVESPTSPLVVAPTPSSSPLPTRLPNPPAEVKAIYFTSWNAATPSRLEEAIRLIKNTELNAIVINIKEETGTIAFNTRSPLIKALKAEEVRLTDFPALINRLHKEGIYVIARIVVFQDQHLPKVRPELAVRNAKTGEVWRDRKGLTWLDPASKEVWDYHIEIAREAARMGVDELNFDYIRFPSDGNLSLLRYPIWDGVKPKHEVIREFFGYLRKELGNLGIPLSADIFGLTTVNADDLGIGQILEHALRYFDFVSPMVYPSHYASGFIGYKNPALYPYEVIKYSLDKAVMRRNALLSATSTDDILVGKPEHQAPVRGEIRPWLQAFNLGADYTPQMIRKEIQAVYDAGLTAGWYLWNPSNVYNAAALLPE
jgi:hypothetical protein